MRYPARLRNGEPSAFWVGGVQLSVAEPFAISLTLMLKAGKDTVVRPSLTRITIFEYDPTCALVGVPARRPVEVLKLAHDGGLEMLKVSRSPLGSLAVGVKAYALPTRTDVAGDPEMVGAPFEDGSDVGGGVVVMVKAGNRAVVLPSVTLI